ncbi:hypothetical protein [Legionella genomosp. 1]|uniref:hypothetical protein n=1 Tax=Legionella genomosp. 1 TaxID=1093625 RepID=UPI001055AED2|nr:hypothetical protein [Legionella genomosp. 1]
MAKNRKIKSPSIQQGKKISVKSEVSSFNKLKPIFSLEHIQKNYCISNCTKDQKAAFADALRKRSQMTWNEITQAHRHGLGQEKIAQTAIKAPLPKDITPETNLIALRFDGKAAMVGRKEGRLFIIYWLDHDFSLYDH